MDGFDLELNEEDGILDVYDGMWMVARYRFLSAKPYFSHLLAPNSLVPGLSKSVIQDSPMDHPHHHGIWWGHGEIGGSDLWLENKDSGRIRHDSFKNFLTTPSSACFTCSSTWLANDKKVCATDQRTFKFTRPEDSYPGWVLDIEYELYPVMKPLAMAKAIDSGLPAFRVSDLIDVFDGGYLVDDRGVEIKFDPPSEPSRWMGAWGRIDSSPPSPSPNGGLLVFDHPSNPGFPNIWFTRPFGWFTPFGTQIADREVPPEGLKLKHRVITFRGELDPKRAEILWHHYAEGSE